VLLRGAQLRNTEWVHGLVIYTGRDSKLIQNMTKTPLKRSSMDKATNRQVIFMFLVLVVLSVVSAICYAVWNAVWAERLWYLQMSSDEGGRGLVSFFLLHSDVPHSLQQPHSNQPHHYCRGGETSAGLSHQLRYRHV
jgi:phospholipid-transporting ATPase